MKSKLLFSAIALAIAGTGLFLGTNKEVSSSYTPRTIMSYKHRSWKNAQEYIKMVKANPVTGKIDPQDVLKAREQVQMLRQQRASLGLQWQELGPDNVGGRTRAILVDKDNSNRLYAGSVTGGLFYSDNAGTSWKPVNDMQANLSISCIAQASNGDIYVGTGSSFEGGGDGSSGALGAGVYKSTYAEDLSFTALEATVPVPNKSTLDWTSVNSIAVDPNDPSKVYAATNYGLLRSTNAGTSWEHLITENTFPFDPIGTAQDILVTNSSRVIVSVEGEIYVSDSGDKNSFTKISTTGSPNGARTEIAMSTLSSDTVYALTETGGELVGLYRSINQGTDWELVQGNIPGYFGTGAGLFNGQANYDLMLGVKPNDPGVVFIGGVQLWRWNLNLTRIAQEFGGGQYYVHSDKHTIVFDPKNPNRMYIGSDGGVTLSVDGGETYWPANKGYNVTQFYAVAYDSDGKIMGGTQDNGTQEIGYVDQTANPLNTGMEAVEIQGGDGYDCDYSNLSTIKFASIYSQQYTRGVDGGGLGPICTSAAPGPICDQGSFYSQVRLWESKNDPTSKDSITFSNINLPQAIQKGNGNQKIFAGNLQRVQSVAKIVPGSVKIYYGNNPVIEVTDVVNGEFSGAGSGTVDYTTGDFSVTFNNPPSSIQTVWAEFNTKYDAGNVLQLFSSSALLPITYKLPMNLNPGDVITIQDPIQSLVAVGKTGGVSITRDGLDLSKSPTWIDISVNSDPHALEFTADGNHLFVGTGYGAGGFLYRISGLNNLYKAADATGNVTVTAMGGISNQTVTGIAIDPNDPNNVVVTLGNYGKTNYVYRSTSALTGNGSFTSIQGNLPAMPVYDAVLPVQFPGYCVIGTEHGVYATENVFANPVVWTDESGTLSNVPVFAVRQQSHGYDISSHRGEIYLGTHGRGFWKTGSLVSTPEIDNNFNSNEFISDLMVYPNPMHSTGTISFNFEKESQATIQIYDLQGKLVKSINNKNYNSGINRVEFNADGLKQGTYFVTMDVEGSRKVSKFMVM